MLIFVCGHIIFKLYKKGVSFTTTDSLYPPDAIMPKLSPTEELRFNTAVY